MTDDVGVSTEIQVDDETRAALLLFNERVEASAAKERGAKRLAKAERAKDEAAAVVRKLAENPDAPAGDKAEAETAYKAALAAYNEIKDNPLAGDEQRKPKAKTEESEEKAADAATEAPSEAPDAVEGTLAETSADDEPVADAGAEVTSTPAEAEE